jgi:hypothetical protein
MVQSVVDGFKQKIVLASVFEIQINDIHPHGDLKGKRRIIRSLKGRNH